MGSSGGSGRKLVADRRNVAPRKPATAQKAKPKRPKRSDSKRKGGNILVRFIRGTVRLFWRLIWGVTWRLGATGGMLLLLATAYFYTTMPPLSELLDARARG
ncbi:MAG: glycosyl transferase, partial [Roseinatronobacter sp.]|nr:glycosyl transferase [Roseinatronobacter sp.]